MFKRGMFLLVCLTAMTSAWAWAATSFQLQTKITNAGGKLTVRTNATQSKAGSLVFSNFTTKVPISVTVTPDSGYAISKITKNGAAVTGVIGTGYTTTFTKGTGTFQTQPTQALVVSFSQATTKLTIDTPPSSGGKIYTTLIYDPKTNLPVIPTSYQVLYNSAGVLTIAPDLTTGKVIGFTVPAGWSVTDLYGNPVSLPYQGVLKATNTKITASGTVTATFSAAPSSSLTAVQQAAFTTCSCHNNSSFASWAASTHAAATPNATTCSNCHVAMAIPANGAACGNCHDANLRTAFANSKHWNNNFEIGPEFTNSSTHDNVVMNANESWKTLENGEATTCAYRCHFKPGMGPDKTKRSTGGIAYTDPQTGKVYNRSTGDGCIACHNSHNPMATYKDTCLTCHSGGKHGVVPNEFFASKHWQNNFEYGPEFANQPATTVVGGSVVTTGDINGVMNANDSYTTTEFGDATTCAYRCHFRPGMGPQKNVAGYLANGKETTFVMYSSPYGAGKFTRPGGDACMACHDSHGLAATARSTCYTCHAGGNHGWSVKAFEKSSHFTGTYAIADGIGGPTGKACTACHNAHSTEAAFFTMSGATGLVKKATNCQQCHTPGSPYSIYDATGAITVAPHGGGVATNSTGGNGTTQFVTQGAICADCHNHNNTINVGFAEGGHGKVSNDPMNAFGHYDWNLRTNNGTRQNGNCDRCHTAYGFIKFANQTTGLTRLQLKTGQANNVLMCVGCHISVEKGTLRTNATPPGNPTPLIGGYFALFSSSAAGITAGNTKIQIQFPGYKNSSICIPCHSGRSTDKVFIETIAKSAAGLKNYTTISTGFYQHAANMAQTFIGTGGYDFTGNLAKVNANGHAKVKNGASDTQGPCVGCHYSSTKTHSLEATGYAGCTTCHNTGFGASNVAAAKANFDAAVAVLDALIKQKFEPLRTDLTLPLETERANVRFGRFGIAAGTVATAATATKAYGAWYNWQILVTYDKAAFVHNPAYARQLLNDTGDYLLNPTGAYGGLSFNAYINTLPGGISTTTRDNALAATKDLGCSGCHLSTPDPYAGNNIIATYNASGHSNSGHGPNCATCHAPSQSVVHPTGANPETSMLKGYVAAGQACINCHNGNYSQSFGPVQHFTNVSSATTPKISITAAYVGYKGKGINLCATCHFTFDPHGIGATTVETFQVNGPVLAAWAESSHGDRSGAAWIPSASHDWRNSGSTVDFQSNVPSNDCVRCHTAAGFAQFATSGYTNVNNVGASDGMKFNSPLDCSACHAKDAVSGSVTADRIAAAGVTTFYNISSVDKVTKKAVKSRIAGKFPNVGESNVCNSCHSARVVGPNLTDLFTTGNWDLSNASFQNSHYMAASGNMYMKTGFKNFTTLTAPAPSNNEGSAFTSSKNYNQTLSPDTATPDGISGGQSSAHRKLGTALINDSEDYLNPTKGGTYGINTNGPCVTCHMKAYSPVAGNTFTPPVAGRPGAGHSLKIDEATAQQLCLQCHADAPHLDGGTGTGTGLYTTMTSLVDIESAMMEPQKTAAQNGLNLVKQILSVKYMINYDPASYPYFYDMQKDATGKTAVTDWTRKNVAGVSNAAVLALGTGNVTVIPAGGLTQLQAYRLMGACFNLNVLARDPGAYLHARTYTQRLVYDTVDYLDNNTMDFTPLATARVLNSAIYSGKEANVLIAAPIGGLATESMAWLAGTHYSDSKGQTSVPLKLRP